MSLSTLRHLIAEAQSLANDGPCAAGHDWVAEGGRACPHEGTRLDCGDSQTVYRCARCGEYDYGERGGPAWSECVACRSASCTCPTECDCEAPDRGLVSNECPVHNVVPQPALDCPAHGERRER